MRGLRVGLCAACLWSLSAVQADEPAARLLIAFASYKERPQHPQVYFYEHDGESQGKLIGGIPPAAKRSDHHPVLTGDGRWCVLASEAEGQPCTLHVFDRTANAFVDQPGLNDTPHAQSAPTVSLDGRWLLADAWSRPQFAGRWDLLAYDLKARTLQPSLALNTPQGDERQPALSGDGLWLAYVAPGEPGQGSDIHLATWPALQPVELPGLNSATLDTEPWLSGDGRWLAFATDRPEGEGGRDIALYDVDARRLVALTGLNSPGQEQSPCLSPDGRYLAFVSERLDGAGERDIYLYDRERERLLPLPGLNSARDDFDPCVVVLPRDR